MPSAAGYAVFSSDRPDSVRPGDILTNPTWDDEDGLQHTVRNLTTEESLHIRLEKWSLDLAEAKALLADAEGAASIAWHPPWPGS